MQEPRRVHPASVIAVLVACPLLSAVTLGAFAVGIARAVGTADVVGIGVVIAAAAFVVNLVALCLALTRGDDDHRVADVAVVEPATEAVAQAS